MRYNDRYRRHRSTERTIMDGIPHAVIPMFGSGVDIKSPSVRTVWPWLMSRVDRLLSRTAFGRYWVRMANMLGTAQFPVAVRFENADVRRSCSRTAIYQPTSWPRLKALWITLVVRWYAVFPPKPKLEETWEYKRKKMREEQAVRLAQRQIKLQTQMDNRRS